MSWSEIMKGFASRKLLVALSGIASVVLINVFGMPQETVDATIQAAVNAFSALAALATALGIVWQYLKTQGEIDKAKARQLPPEQVSTGKGVKKAAA